jgi:hypothetical protein
LRVSFPNGEVDFSLLLNFQLKVLLLTGAGFCFPHGIGEPIPFVADVNTIKICLHFFPCESDVFILGRIDPNVFVLACVVVQIG